MNLNPVCPKFISNKQVFGKIGVRIFEFLLYSGIVIKYDLAHLY